MSKPKDCITVPEAQTLQANWNNNQAEDIESVRGTKDVIAVTFNIDQLQQFIDYVNTESTKQSIDKPGIRVYFAAKGSSEGGNATAFLTATDSDDGDSANNYKIAPLNRGNGGYPPSVY